MKKGYAVGRWTCNRCNTLIEIDEAMRYEPPYSNLSYILCPECYKIMKSKEDEIMKSNACNLNTQKVNKIINKVCFEIDNCCDCPYHYKEKIYTTDPWEHEEGVYCSKMKDTNSYNKKHKLVVADDYNVRKWSQIPDWCPLKSN